MKTNTNMLRRVVALAALAVACVAATCTSVAQAQIRITEYTANPSPEWVEFTNIGNSAIDLTGWSWSDSDQQPFDQPSLGTVGIIGPHESFIFTEASESTFRSMWNLPLSVKVVGNNTNSNLSSGGDEINIYDASGGLVDRLTYSSAFAAVGNTRNVPLASLGANQASLTVTSILGDSYGSYAATTGRVGNPGIYTPIRVPEPTSVVLSIVGFFATIGLTARRRS